MLTEEIKRTAALAPAELIEIMAARVRVFVVEQHCPYQEIDAKDGAAQHVILRQGGKLAAYARIVPHDDGVSVSFGRVLVPAEYRGHGYGRQLIQAVLAQLATIAPHQQIKIQAQNYLRAFYAQFGFSPVSAVYLEDGIPHVDMVKTPKR
ncbi:GNAT family N-acetyltransferase [Lacticaseibacillus jixianensis]|uniref:GNAT family N-acetyltransferase n=1 Tax=Lacticaseibacillus jixianensis TaxID=2486012 RepID=A0ABW4BBE5_9LACO|nr:GNAT family N-acetyltransferase [Lacticaseibacillus jixianensis]